MACNPEGLHALAYNTPNPKVHALAYAPLEGLRLSLYQPMMVLRLGLQHQIQRHTPRPTPLWGAYALACTSQWWFYASAYNPLGVLRLALQRTRSKGTSMEPLSIKCHRVGGMPRTRFTPPDRVSGRNMTHARDPNQGF